MLEQGSYAGLVRCGAPMRDVRGLSQAGLTCSTVDGQVRDLGLRLRMADAGGRIMGKILAVAPSETTVAELLGYGEFSIEGVEARM